MISRRMAEQAYSITGIGAKAPMPDGYNKPV